MRNHERLINAIVFILKTIPNHIVKKLYYKIESHEKNFVTWFDIEIIDEDYRGVYGHPLNEGHISREQLNEYIQNALNAGITNYYEK